DWSAAVGHLASAIGDHAHGPYALFGHSMGGLLAFDVTARLEAHGERPPVWLGVSAYPQPAPHEPGRHLLPSERLRELAARLGGLPQIVLDSDHLWPEVETRLRRDLALLDSRTAGRSHVRTPLSLYRGQRDPVIASDGMRGWHGLASRVLGVRVYPGGHFYFQDRVSDVVADIVHDIRHCLPDERFQPCVP
ncbi:thioesterase II family protein, partial [Nocardiopsis halotolerans]|uniref:thioesterase II family protein n=1 Tax=Nocardiopsis halotolerans TaxID=124252 RepID=UPI000381B2FA